MKHEKQTTNFHGASSVISHLKNQIVGEIWKGLAPYLSGAFDDKSDFMRQDKYFEINRALNDVLDKFIGVYGASYKIEKPYYKDEMFSFVASVISRQVADEIFKDDSTVVREYNSEFYPQVEFIAEVPYLKLQDKMKRSPPQTSAAESEEK